MYLDEIREAEGSWLEDMEMECKARLDRGNVIGWLKTVAGFANADGGVLWIGVEDKTNKLIGFDRAAADNERNYFNNAVNGHLVPRPQIKIAFVRYEVRGKEMFLLRVSVPESAVKPVVLKYDGVPSIFMRRDGFTNGATYEEIIEMGIRSSKTQYDVLPSGIAYRAEDFSDLMAFHAKHAGGSKSLTEKRLRSIGFFDDDGMLANGALLFADGCSDQKTEVVCSLFSGRNKGSERIVTANRYRGNLTHVIEYVLEFVNLRMNHSILKLEHGRRNIDAYPQRALFEGVVNAVVHRDYYLDGTQIQVDMFRDRLEISSPGGFYGSGKFGKTYDLSGIISKRRNVLISDVLVSCDVMEAAGTGFDKIMEDYAGSDKEHSPYIFSSSDHFTLVLPDLTYEDGVEDGTMPSLAFLPAIDGTHYDETVLCFCYRKARKASEIAAHLGISDSSYLRNRILGNLVRQGYLIRKKQKNAVHYVTNPDMVAEQ